MHCMKARISICHDQIKVKKRAIQDTLNELTPLVSADSLFALKNFLKKRAQAVRNSIDTMQTRQQARQTTKRIQSISELC